MTILILLLDVNIADDFFVSGSMDPLCGKLTSSASLCLRYRFVNMDLRDSLSNPGLKSAACFAEASPRLLLCRSASVLGFKDVSDPQSPR